MTRKTSGWEVRNTKTVSGQLTLTWNPQQLLRSLGPTDVMIEIQAAALNYRDISIVRGNYPLSATDGVVPGCDASAEVIHIGERVTRFKVGDKVLPFVYQADALDGSPISLLTAQNGLGGGTDGTFRRHAIYDQEGLSRMPSTLSFEQAAALGSAYLTAWNCLVGGMKRVGPGDHVLVQGSGGVSIAALQLARAAGATVIATTSNNEKAQTLKALGAMHVINYVNEPMWGKAVRSKTPSGLGCSFVIDVVGTPSSFSQSLDALAAGGEMQVVGYLDNSLDNGQINFAGPTFLETLYRNIVVRGVIAGNRQQFEEMLNVVECTDLKPVVDYQMFDLMDLEAAYDYLAKQKHFGKVIIKMK